MSIIKKIYIIILLLFSLWTIIGQEKKTALVIGNGDYQYFGKLKTPVKEAREMKETLEKIGFEVILVENAGYDAFFDAIMEFEKKLKQNRGIALFHYGGHGVQVKGANYLLPVDKEIPDELRCQSRAINLNEILYTMEASGTSANIIIVDACRDNPLPRESRSSDSRGLAPIGKPPVNSIIVYSADAGQTAQDGLFTPVFMKYLLNEKGVDITEILLKVKREIFEITKGKQMPGEYNKLISKIYLTEDLEKRWKEKYEKDFIYVQGGTFKSKKSNYYGKNVTISDLWISRYEVTVGEWKEYLTSTGTTFDWDNNYWGNKPVSKYSPGDKHPMINVSWYQVVEYCNWRSVKEGLRPCYNLKTWECDFSANGYRLPTEAEWEYAATGGQKSQSWTYSGSDDINEVAEYEGNNNQLTKPVGSKKPNELGIYDMSGNVWEWCYDWYDTDFINNLKDIKDPVNTKQNSDRVARGGSWYSDDNSCQIISRYYWTSDSRYGNLGFRLVRKP